MTQKIFGMTIGATGIVGTLIVAGVILIATKASAPMGSLAIFAGVMIGIILGILGVIAVAKRVIG